MQVFGRGTGNDSIKGQSFAPPPPNDVFSREEGKSGQGHDFCFTVCINTHTHCLCPLINFGHLITPNMELLSKCGAWNKSGLG